MGMEAAAIQNNGGKICSAVIFLRLRAALAAVEPVPNRRECFSAQGSCLHGSTRDGKDRSRRSVARLSIRRQRAT
jgi:hypothetical protein